MPTWQTPPPHPVRVGDEATRAEIEECLLHLRDAQRRAPMVMAERFHAKYDALLTDWEQAPA
jgi:hypothetical protein